MPVPGLAALGAISGGGGGASSGVTDSGSATSGSAGARFDFGNQGIKFNKGPSPVLLVGVALTAVAGLWILSKK